MDTLRLPIAALRTLAVIALVAALAGCSIVPKAPVFSGTGTVVSVREVREPSPLATVVGAVGGALIGGIAGANVGGGSGQIAAASVMSVVGGTGGAMLAQWFGTRVRYEVLARFEDGIDRAYTLDTAPALRPGASVRVVDGQLQR
jgi:outer membrane lipoprotein SlyB